MARGEEALAARIRLGQGGAAPHCKECEADVFPGDLFLLILSPASFWVWLNLSSCAPSYLVDISGQEFLLV